MRRMLAIAASLIGLVACGTATASQDNALRQATLNYAVKQVALHADQARRFTPNTEPVAAECGGGASGQAITHVQRGLQIIHTVIEQQ